MICFCCNIKGRVQGVFFRDSTRQQASSLNITGYAKNLPDGSVEVLACGKKTDIESLKDWLKQGPPSAHVDKLLCEDKKVSVPAGFLIY